VSDPKRIVDRVVRKTGVPEIVEALARLEDGDGTP